jgi:hypothetical protein
LAGEDNAAAKRSIQFDPITVAEIVRRSRAGQGLPPTVESPVMMAKLALLVGAVLVQK